MLPGATYTEAELDAMLSRMQTASDTFYVLAIQTGCHNFIEFCGLMNEYIKVCRQSCDAGLDFTRANVHAGGALLVHDYNMQYMAEKFACIFDTTLANPAMREIFLQAVLGKAGQ